MRGADLWQIASYGAGWFRHESVKPDDEWYSLQENTVRKSKNTNVSQLYFGAKRHAAFLDKEQKNFIPNDW